MAAYVLVLDHGTTGLKVCLMDKGGNIVGHAYEKIPQIYPQPGWVEQDAQVLWELTVSTIKRALETTGITWQEVACVGLTNQRETTILWDKETGKPVYHAIVWQCRRTAQRCDGIKLDEGQVKDIQTRTGLVVDAYFSATKIQWMLKHVPEAKTLAQENRLLFGTVDSWILWNLTGGKVHATDYTNASRTMVYNIREKQWDETLLALFGIPRQILPEVKPSSGEFGVLDPALTGGHRVPVSGMIGDQQSALYGQKCWTPGSVKNTFGTGAFLVCNTGDQFLISNRGLLTTLACDAQGQPCYALEGAIFIAGAVLEWMKDSLALFNSFDEADQMARSLPGNDGVYVVPAFVGLGAPYWVSDVRGMITGLTQGTGKAHLVRAGFESMAYQTAQMVGLMQEASGLTITALKVDGGVSRSAFLMQFLADLMQIPAVQLMDSELTAKGAGFLAGLAAGVWQGPSEIEALAEESRVFQPGMAPSERDRLMEGWTRAVGQVLASAPAVPEMARVG